MKCRARETGAVFEYLVWTGENQREMFDFLTFGEKIDDYMSASGEHFRIDFNYSPKGGLVIKMPPKKGDARTEPGDYIVKNERGFRPYTPRFFNEVFEIVEDIAENTGPIEEFETPEQLEECLRWWQHKLYLDSWMILAHTTDEIVDDKGENQDYTEGFNTFVFESSQASIQILTKKAHDENNMLFKYCAEKVLVHELLHCKYAWMDNQGSYEGVYVCSREHQLLEEMAKSLIMAKYNLDYNYFI